MENAKIAIKLVGSEWVFRITILVFTAEAGWLSLTSRYPMAFDEPWHFGLIRFYAHRINPLVTSQDSSSYPLGNIVQNPSFLYHYLLSFPDRLITLFTPSLEAQIVGLRLVNVALAVAGLFVARKLLKLIGVSGTLANTVLFVYAMTPIVMALSAQINYDNLLILMTLLCLYETVFFLKKLDRQVFDMKSLMILICLCIFASLVKFTFMPIFLGILMVLGWRTFLYRRHYHVRLLAKAKQGFSKIGKYSKSLLLITLALGTFLFARFYVVNLVRYHNPIPPCNKVLSVQACERYYSWDEAYMMMRHKAAHPVKNVGPVKYSAKWLYTMFYGIFGAIMPLQGPYSIAPVFSVIVLVILSTSLACTIVSLHRIWKHDRSLWALTGIAFVYLLFLWAYNYHDYVRLGAPSAIDGRYVIPVLLIMYAVLARGLQYVLLLERKYMNAKLALIILVFFVFARYGGYAQYESSITPRYGKLSSSRFNYNFLDDTQRGY